MANWKLALLWLVVMVWRLGSAAILVFQGQEEELKLRTDWTFWGGYIYLWIFLQYPDASKANRRSEGMGDALYCLAWVFLIGMTGLAIEFLVWVLLRILFDIEVRIFWGEVFTVVFATICLYVPLWLRRNTIKTRELL